MLIYISNKYIGNKIDKKQHLYTHFAGSDHTTVDSAARTCNTASIALGFRWKPPLRAYSQWPRESSADLYACTQHTQHNIKHLCVFFFFLVKLKIKTNRIQSKPLNNRMILRCCESPWHPGSSKSHYISIHLYVHIMNQLRYVDYRREKRPMTKWQAGAISQSGSRKYKSVR